MECRYGLCGGIVGSQWPCGDSRMILRKLRTKTWCLLPGEWAGGDVEEAREMMMRVLDLGDPDAQVMREHVKREDGGLEEDGWLG